MIQIGAEINDIEKRIQRKSMKPKRGPLRGSIKLIVVLPDQSWKKKRERAYITIKIESSKVTTDCRGRRNSMKKSMNFHI